LPGRLAAPLEHSFAPGSWGSADSEFLDHQAFAPRARQLDDVDLCEEAEPRRGLAEKIAHDTTGATMIGIAPHKNAGELRAQGKI
jgi:hypothetical protein